MVRTLLIGLFQRAILARQILIFVRNTQESDNYVHFLVKPSIFLSGLAVAVICFSNFDLVIIIIMTGVDFLSSVQYY